MALGTDARTRLHMKIIKEKEHLLDQKVDSYYVENEITFSRHQIKAQRNQLAEMHKKIKATRSRIRALNKKLKP